MFEVKKEKNEDRVVVYLSGDLSIAYVADIKKVFMELEMENMLEIHIAANSEYDFAFVQLLFAIIKNYKKNGRIVYVSNSSPIQIIDAIYQFGFKKCVIEHVLT